MSIASATVEGNGWVLAVRGTWASSTFASFPLTPDATPKVVLTLRNAPGFTRSGGQAVPTVWDRGAAVIATVALRQPAPPQGASTSTTPVLDEIDHGDGTRTVRLALSDRVLAGETISVAFAAGWRTGLSAAVVSATNSSTRQPIAPISRWAIPHLLLTEGTTQVPVECIIASHYPRHFGPALHQAVAAVRFRATDGTNFTPWVWVTGPTISSLYGDNLKCWRANIDCSALTPGVISIMREEYPWIGSVKTVGTAHSTNALLFQSPLPGQVLHACYDPTGSRYGSARRFVYVDAATGVTTAAAVTVGTTGAAARAGTRAASVTIALQAMRLVNHSLPAANGFPGGTRGADWWEIWLAPGTQTFGNATVDSGFGAKEGLMVVRGDPDHPDPRTACILASQATAPVPRNGRWLLRDQSIRLGDSALLGTSGSTSGAWTDNVDLRDRPGATSNFLLTAPAAGLVNVTHLRTFSRGIGSTPLSTNWRAGFWRNCDFSRAMRGHTIISCMQNWDAAISYGGSTGDPAFAGISVSGAFDQMVWGCRGFRGNGLFYDEPVTNGGSFTLAASPAETRRFAVINCLAEAANNNTTGNSKFTRMGETRYQSVHDCIIEGVTSVGRRASWHNDPPDNSIGTNQATGNVVRNALFDRWSSKTDTFGSPPHGSRTGMWEIHWAVGFWGIVDAQRTAFDTDTFAWQYFGRSSVNTTPATGQNGVSPALFMDDRSNFSPVATPPGGSSVGPGNGDYRIRAGSVCRGLGAPASIDVDVAGASRPAQPAAGAFEPELVPLPPLPLPPAKAVHMVAGGEPRLVPLAPLQPAPARHGWVDGGSVLSIVDMGGPTGGAPSRRTLVVTATERVIRPR